MPLLVYQKRIGSDKEVLFCLLNVILVHLNGKPDHIHVPVTVLLNTSKLMIFLALFKEIFVLGQKRSLMLEAVFFHGAVGIQHSADMEFVEFQLKPDMRLVRLSNIQHTPTIPNMILNLINAAPA